MRGAQTFVRKSVTARYFFSRGLDLELLLKYQKRGGFRAVEKSQGKIKRVPNT